MKDYELKAETGKYAVNAPPIETFAFGKLVLDVRGPFFEHMATFMVAWAGLMSREHGRTVQEQCVADPRVDLHVLTSCSRLVGSVPAKLQW